MADNGTTGPALRGTDYVARAYGFVMGDWPGLLRTMLPWLLPLLALELWPILDPTGYAARANAALIAVASGTVTTQPDPALLLYPLALSLLQTLMLSGFAIARHREVLHAALPPLRPLGASLLPYFGYWLLAGLVAVVLILIVSFILTATQSAASAALTPWLLLAVLFGILLILLRGVLIFPAIALGHTDMTIELSFRLTAPDIWRIAGGAAVMFLPALFASALWAGLAAPILAPAGAFAGPTLVALVALAIDFTGVALFVAYVSLLYAHYAGVEVPRPTDWNSGGGTFPRPPQ
jgi:hypothetical protein